MDIELQDAVTKGQESDDAALEALKKLENPETQSTKWHICQQRFIRVVKKKQSA